MTVVHQENMSMKEYPLEPQFYTVKLGCEGVIEPPHGKTNNVVFEQVQHKSGCTATKDS